MREVFVITTPNGEMRSFVSDVTEKKHLMFADDIEYALRFDTYPEAQIFLKEHITEHKVYQIEKFFVHPDFKFIE